MDNKSKCWPTSCMRVNFDMFKLRKYFGMFNFFIYVFKFMSYSFDAWILKLHHDLIIHRLGYFLNFY